MPDTSAGVNRLAVSRPSVMTTTARRRSVLRDAARFAALRDRIVERGGAERIDLPQRTLQGTRIDRERRHLMQPAVKREQRCFIATRLQPRKHVMGRKLRSERAIGHAHTAADIEQNRETHRRRLGSEIRDPTLSPASNTSKSCDVRPFTNRPSCRAPSP